MDIYEKINRGVYKVNIPYPTKANFTSDVTCTKCDCNRVVYDVDSHVKARTEYHAEKLQKMNEFKQDCFEQYGIKVKPYKEFIFSAAWERGHSSGFHEVVDVMEDLVDLAIKIEKSLMG